MAQAQRDQNQVTTLIVASDADGVTPINVYADPFTHSLFYETTLDVLPQKSVAPRDQNNVPTAMAISRDDGVTPVVIYGDPLTNSIYFSM